MYHGLWYRPNDVQVVRSQLRRIKDVIECSVPVGISSAGCALWSGISMEAMVVRVMNSKPKRKRSELVKQKI